MVLSEAFCCPSLLQKAKEKTHIRQMKITNAFFIINIPPENIIVFQIKKGKRNKIIFGINVLF
jgi:hypothetical protein